MNSGSQNPNTASNAGLVRHAADTFEGRAIPRVHVRGQWWWPARQVGVVIEQGDDGKRFVRNVTENLGGEYVDGLDFVWVAGSELAQVRAALAEGADSAPSQNDSVSGDAAGRPMLLLSRSGLNLALMHSRKELGKRFRAWLARDVVPAIQETGRYGDAAPTSQIADAVVKLTSIAAAHDGRLAELHGELKAMRVQLTTATFPHGMIQRAEADKIRGEMRACANLRTGLNGKGVKEERAAWSRARGQIEGRVRAAAKHPMGRRWDDLDPAQLHATWDKLKEEKRDAEKTALRATPLFGKN